MSHLRHRHHEMHQSYRDQIVGFHAVLKDRLTALYHATTSNTLDFTYYKPLSEEHARWTAVCSVMLFDGQQTPEEQEAFFKKTQEFYKKMHDAMDMQYRMIMRKAREAIEAEKG